MLSQEQLGRLNQGENAFAALYQRLRASLEQVRAQLEVLPAILRPIDWLSPWAEKTAAPTTAAGESQEAPGPGLRAWPWFSGSADGPSRDDAPAAAIPEDRGAPRDSAAPSGGGLAALRALLDQQLARYLRIGLMGAGGPRGVSPALSTAMENVFGPPGDGASLGPARSGANALRGALLSWAGGASLRQAFSALETLDGGERPPAAGTQSDRAGGARWPRLVIPDLDMS